MLDQTYSPSFLDLVVADIRQSIDIPLEQQGWIVPTRRAGIFLRESLIRHFRQTIWAPQIYSIQDFIRNLTQWQFPEPLSLIFELYQVYTSHMSQQAPIESFERFYNWGEMLLKDFDEIDKYEADASQLFSNIRDLKEIEAQFSLPTERKSAIQRFWETIYLSDYASPSELQQKFLGVWEKLYPIYNAYREQLSLKGLAYDGMAYKWISQRLNHPEFDFPMDWINFIGFNALSTSEERIIHHILDQSRGYIYWDVDRSYFQVEKDESIQMSSHPGKFIRYYHNRWRDKGSKLIVHHSEAEPKDIYLEGVALPTGQAHYLAGLLTDQVLKSTELRRHAIVLADESLLFPVLYDLPPTVDQVNITMGFPLKHTPMYHLLSTLTLLLRNMRQNKTETEVAYQDVLQILGNAYIQTLSPSATQRIREMIVHKNLVYIPTSLMKSQIHSELFTHIFQLPSQPEGCVTYFHQIFDTIIKDAQARQARLEAEYVFQLFTHFNRFKDILQQYNADLTFYGFSRLFKETLAKARIPFEGEPLTGLQIMGFLETRVLDFDHVYILGANEGHLPDTRTANSVIPYPLRRGFGLPTYEEKDTIYAYHFFRLLQRSRKVHLIYNTIVKDQGGAGEISRFLQQLRYYFRDHPQIHIHERQINTPVPYSSPRAITFALDDEVAAFFQRHYMTNDLSKPAPRYLSATALTTYLGCPLRFYFKYIADLEEPEMLEEQMEAGTFGTILHEALERVYTHQKGYFDMDQLKTHLLPALKEAFEGQSLDWERAIGMNFLFKDALIELCEQILQHDATSKPFEIQYLEEKSFFETHLPLQDRWVRINGTFDRVDYLPETETVRIIDYKTGRARLTNYTDWDKLFASDDYKEMFQGYLYAWLYHQKYPDARIQMAFYPLREIRQGRMYLNQGKCIEPEMLKAFEQYLYALLEQLFSADFTQVEDEKKCVYCPYKEICNRG